MMYSFKVPGGPYQKFTYPAGEMQVRFNEAERQKITSADRIVVTCRASSGEMANNLMELAHAVDAVGGLTSPLIPIDIVLPYLPYSRADRRFVEGDCWGLSVMSRVLNSLDRNNVITLDVHSGRAQKLVDRLVNVSPNPLIQVALNCLPIDTAVILPDEGAKRYSIDRAPTYQCSKKRNPITGALLGFEVPVDAIRKHSAALIVDDICDGGGTFIGIADQLQGMPLWLYTTHGIYSKGTEELNKRFRGMMASDSFTTEFTGVTRLPAMSLLVGA